MDRLKMAHARVRESRMAITRRYTPASSLSAPASLLAAIGRDLRASHELARRLAIRDLKAQYRTSYLGYLWAFITPLVNTALWVVLSSTGVVKLADTGMPYPAFVFSGTMMWQVFVEALGSPLLQVTQAKGMLSKLDFPRESLVLSGFYKVLSNALVRLVVLVPALSFFGIWPDARLALVPVALIALVLAGMGIGLLLAPVGTLYSDINRTLPFATQFLMYLTPVVFALPAEGTMARLISLNPLTPLVLSARSWVTAAPSPMLGYFLAVLAASIVLCALGLMFYRITMTVLIERMSA